MQELVRQAVDFIQARVSLRPEFALVLGSGLGDFANAVDGIAISYSDIPHFPVATAPGHVGALIVGTLLDRPCVVMQGRVHMYEGYDPQQVTFPIRVMAALGARTLLLTNAAGGIRPDYRVGDLVVIEDHLSLAVAAGLDPLRGPNDSEAGPRFPSMNKAYDADLIDLVQRLAPEVQRGVYAHVVGPSFEPPALIRLLRLAGCDLVGMSTVPEVIVARHVGLKVLAISAITDIAVSAVDHAHITTENEVWASMTIVRPKLRALMEQLIPTLPIRHE
ncbi:purine-nucleoside phosphorylase (plasmid) [Rhizobium lusitanum]|uniref:purine-nucleoside phosphorylase n=1 Tax=Rhizobium lusitanum TaxID=293958 RepID=UPI00160A7547|nr:purine-nucleoside phosphorylase [Rhizobium lusitanum]QND44616.1 purine-nucleoside phosphorylase [Rhizobium lusitanum]